MPELRGDRFERVLRYARSRAREIGVRLGEESAFVDRHLCEWGRACVKASGRNEEFARYPVEVIYDSGRPVGVRVDV